MLTKATAEIRAKRTQLHQCKHQCLMNGGKLI